MKKHFLLAVVVLCLSGLVSWLSLANAAESPTSMLNSAANQMIAGLKANEAHLKSNPSIIYSLARKIVVPRADLDEMSKRVLPSQTWNSATPAQRKEFQREMTTLLIRTYASALAEYSDQTVKFYPVRGGGSSVTVNSQIIRSDGPSIAVNYRVIFKGSWKLIDMTVEGVSMLESFRSQFADKLSQGNMASLIIALKHHNSRG